MLSITQNFRGQHGKAYLFDTAQNLIRHELREANMTTGRHFLRDISCRKCKEIVGWYYEKADEATEKYKEGKWILETELICDLSVPLSKGEGEQRTEKAQQSSSRGEANQIESYSSSMTDQMPTNDLAFSNASTEKMPTLSQTELPKPVLEDIRKLTGATESRPSYTSPQIAEYINGLKHLDDQQILVLLQAARAEEFRRVILAKERM